MIGNGYSDAPDYPIGLVWEENELVVERLNGILATEGSILQAAASTAVAAFGKDGGKKAHKAFADLLGRLSGIFAKDPDPKTRLAERRKKEKGDGR